MKNIFKVLAIIALIEYIDKFLLVSYYGI